MFKEPLSFRFRLTSAIVLVSVGATILGLFYYYSIASAQIWSQMTSRVKDFGKIGITQFNANDLKFLQKLDLELNPAGRGNNLAALAEDEKTQIIRKNEFQYIVQKLRHLRQASAKDLVQDLTLAASSESTREQPLIHRVWIAGVRMHLTAPNYLRVLCADELEEIDRNNNRRVDPDERIYKIGDIFNGEQQAGIAAAMRGEISISDGYHKESSGIYITGYTPIFSSTGKIIALLIVDFSAATEFDALFKLKITGYYIIVGVLFLAVIAAATISRILLRPLDGMQLAAARIGRRDFSVRLQADGADELAELAFAMNLMAHELGEYSVNMEKRITERTHEITEILNGLEQGLLTVNNLGVIGTEYSGVTAKMLGTQEIAHRKFSSFFKEKGQQAAVDKYLELFFADHILTEQILERANPIRQVKFIDESGEIRYLRFRFIPLKSTDSKPAKRILVSIVDDTQQKNLQLRISEAEAEKRGEFDAIINLMHIPPAILENFLQQQQAFLDQGKRIISSFEQTPNQEFVIFAGEVHALKGNASQLSFNTLAEELHKLEDFLGQKLSGASSELKYLRHEISRHINAADFLITGQKKLTERIKALVGRNETADPQIRLRQLMSFWQNLIEERAARGEIPIRCSIRFAEGTENTIHLLHNIVVQLVRNTFAHGAESIEERALAGKTPELSIDFSLIRHEGKTIATYSEDGRGFPGLLAGQSVELASLSQKGLTGTQKSATLESGRGLGMEYISNTIRSLGGTATVKKSGLLTQFVFNIPE